MRPAQHGIGVLGVLFAALFMGGFYAAQCDIAHARPQDSGVEMPAVLVHPIIEMLCDVRVCVPKRPRLLHPRTPAVRPPEIFCVSPDDPDAAMPCEQLLTPASRRGAGGS